jgi:hypothetical protein
LVAALDKMGCKTNVQLKALLNFGEWARQHVVDGRHGISPSFKYPVVIMVFFRVIPFLFKKLPKLFKSVTRYI